MERSIWAKFAEFIQACYTKHFKENLAGIIMGYIGSRSVLFINVPPELMHTWIGVWIWIKTVFTAFTAGLATAYAGYLVEKYKENQKKSPQTKRKRNKAA